LQCADFQGIAIKKINTLTHTDLMSIFFRCFCTIAFFAFVFSSCLTTANQYQKLAPGVWRGVIEIEKPFYPAKDKRKKSTVLLVRDQYLEGELPFNFTVNYTDELHFYIEIFNGTERIRCDSIAYGWDKTTAHDTMNIFFPEYQSYIHADIRGNLMAGEWIVTSKENYRIPFRAKSGQGHRFTTMQEKPVADLTGEWATNFGINEPKPERAIGEFRQKDNHLEGTFRTETGDYRFLEGTVQGEEFSMSCFDGSHAFLFSGKIKGDSLQGEFRSGTHYKTLWTAWKDPKFKLGNPDSLTLVKKNANQTLLLDLKTPEGKAIKYPSADFDGKVKIFTVSGTWCPNCRDEQLFLKEFFEKNPDLAQKTAVTVLSFERGDDIFKINKQLTHYKKQLGIPFDIVYAGKAKTEEAAKILPFLDKIMAFPTLLVLDKKGKIQKVHTGFDGPATSKYADFKNEFATLMQKLCNE
jgi:thiol-disulfide isomerase/thioredoxin